MASNTARIAPGSFLTLHYRLAGPAGDIINTFAGKPATLTNSTMSSGRASRATAERTVRARSAAEMPVVTPLAASIETVNLVP